MRFTRLSYIVPLLGISPAQAENSCSNQDLTVYTSSGTFTGFVNSSTPDVNQWLGIPYGTPPTGSRRFMPPEPAPYGGISNANSYKPICFQDSTVGQGVFWELVPQFQNVDPQSEDCLYLNIWGPRKPVNLDKTPAKKVPIIIWVCGGGYREGGGHAPYQVPDHWIQRMQTHIVIAFNYRLNVFGFPGARAAGKNAGLLDVRLVVEWVRDNIEGFGGDPDRIVLWGQSAGANAVDSYSYANPKDPIVSGLIADSGAVATSATTNTTAFTDLAGFFGCGGLNATEELSCMQKVDAHDIQNLLEKGLTSGNASIPNSWGPVVDNVTYFANATERMEKGLVARVPLITGNNINEGAAFAPFSLNETTPPPASVLQTGLDMIACPVKTEVEARASHGLPTYRYLFAGNFSNITPRYWLGAMHSSELPIVFGTHYEFRGNSTELEWLTSYAMEALWVSFASDSSSNPTDGTGLTWPRYTSCGSQMVLFANDSKPAQLVPGTINDDHYQCSASTPQPS